MLSALEQGGASIGVLADSLLRTSASKAYRDGLRDNRLLLLSPFYPEAGFTPANAMARNKYIYALSQAVVVVKSALTGGTWAGANENLKHNWCPLWVRNNDHPGNQELIKRGAHPMAEDFACFNSPQPELEQAPAIDDLFATPDTVETPAEAPSTATESTAETLDTTAPVTAATAPTGQPEKTVVRINPTEIFSQQTKGTYIETQAEVDAYLNALKDKLQAALDQHQRINIQ
jgi:predicted Rossmann fold nucleotide-binding protein DprA/Smf involved in DNA uptake